MKYGYLKNDSCKKAEYVTRYFELYST
jgi:hypothetical protein